MSLRQLMVFEIYNEENSYGQYLEALEVEGDILLFPEVSSFDKLLTMIDAATTGFGVGK